MVRQFVGDASGTDASEPASSGELMLVPLPASVVPDPVGVALELAGVDALGVDAEAEGSAGVEFGVESARSSFRQTSAVALSCGQHTAPSVPRCSCDSGTQIRPLAQSPFLFEVSQRSPSACSEHDTDEPIVKSAAIARVERRAD
jgi:hypothetical protein